MIASLDRNYVMVTPAKTGSTSWGGWLINFCSGVSFGKTHDWKIEDAYLQCTPLLSVRNPYDRCMSLWWWSCADPTRNPKCHLYGCSFVKYMHRLLWFRDHPDKGHQTPEVYMDLAMYADVLLAQTGKEPIALHLESHVTDLQNTGMFTEEEIRHYRVRNISGTRPLVSAKKFLSGMEEDLVWQYCQEDFIRFGYSRLPREIGKLRAW